MGKFLPGAREFHWGVGKFLVSVGWFCKMWVNLTEAWIDFCKGWVNSAEAWVGFCQA